MGDAHVPDQIAGTAHCMGAHVISAAGRPVPVPANHRIPNPESRSPLTGNGKPVTGSGQRQCLTGTGHGHRATGHGRQTGRQLTATGRPRSVQTLNLKSSTSPSATTYSFPSDLTAPFSRGKADCVLVELQTTAQRQLRSVCRQRRRHRPRTDHLRRRVRRVPDVQPRWPATGMGVKPGRSNPGRHQPVCRRVGELTVFAQRQ